MTVHLPAGSRVDARTSVAELTGVGRLGDVIYEGATGTVKLEETGSARLTLATGDITVGRVHGPAEISTQKGDLIVGEAVTGAVTAALPGGTGCRFSTRMSGSSSPRPTRSICRR